VPNVIVVDASVVLAALTGDNEDGDRARARLREQHLAAPELVDVEVLSVLRRDHLRGSIARRRAEQAIADLADLPIDRFSHRSFLVRCWELRDNLTAYDAVYVALAEALRATLLTGDRKLSNAPGLRCAIEVLD
jgi:predicted nucleic acid-binding protein